MRLLVTGFEPFGRHQVNPSQRVIERLEAGLGDHGADHELATFVLPVLGNFAADTLVRLLRRNRPDVVVMLGQGRRNTGFHLERFAVNLRDYRIADQAGTVVREQPVVRGGPDAYFSTLPLEQIRASLQAERVPAEISLTASTYLCNEVAYAALHELATSADAYRVRTRAGFIHVPMLPEQAADEKEPTPSMSEETLMRGVRAMIAAVLDETPSPGRTDAQTAL